MRAIIVSVDYADLLAITLPYNRHHFEEIYVVTTPEDKKTIQVCQDFDFTVNLVLTRSFYLDGAIFNKWRALEEGFDAMGRHGWIANMDADVLWPKDLYLYESTAEGLCNTLCEFGRFDLVAGNLYTPRRRMWEDWPKAMLGWEYSKLPDESIWPKFPLHPQQQEFAGYTQIFHAQDVHLGPAPWHETNWRHAGGADSFFQQKWPESCKIRPPFEVLHLGPAGKNWCGRATPLADGTIPPDAAYKKQQLRAFIANRTLGPDRFKGEKIN